MTRLLVSVRSAAEAQVALDGGADIIDVKEPRRGALGPADPSVWKEILETIAGRATVSAALGELHSDEIGEYACRAAGFAYAKIGLSDWRRRRNSPGRFIEIKLALPSDVCAVPVIYADVEATGWNRFTASALAGIAMTSALRLPFLVIDTFRKDTGGLLDLVSISALQRLSVTAAQNQIPLVLAGSLNEDAIEKLLPLQPAYIGVRGAACTGGRDGTIDLARVKSLARLVHGECQKAAS